MKILCYDFNNIMVDLKKEIIKCGHKLLPQDGDLKTIKKADCIVIWNETDLGGWRDFVPKFQKLGKKVILLQHGRRGTSRIFPPFNEKLLSDIVCVWSENDRKRLISCGIPDSRIRITGTSIFSHLKPRQKHEGINVVFSPEHWDVDVAENFIIKNQLEKLKGVKVISKLLIGEHTQGIYPNPVWSDRNVEGHLEKCAEVLSTADIVVAVSESTFELCAEYLDIPVIIADIWTPKPCGGDERYREYNREYSNACMRVKDISKLNEEIMYALKYPEVLREERAKIAIDDGGVDIDKPLEEFIKVILEK